MPTINQQFKVLEKATHKRIMSDLQLKRDQSKLLTAAIEAVFKDFDKSQLQMVKKSSKKDPNAPKKPQNAYMLYSNKVRASMQKKHPELKVNDLMKKIGESWKTLNEKEKAKYTAQSKTANEEYKTKYAEYQKTIVVEKTA